MNNKHDNDKELRKQLERERNEELKNNKSPSLVSLVEGDDNTILKPMAFLTLLGTIISAVIIGATQVTDFKNNIDTVQTELNSQQAAIVELRGDLTSFERSLRGLVTDRTEEYRDTVSALATRLVELNNKVDTEIRINTSTIESQSVQVSTDLLGLRETVADLNAQVRRQEISLYELETQLRILEVRMSHLTDQGSR